MAVGEGGFHCTCEVQGIDTMTRNLDEYCPHSCTSFALHLLIRDRIQAGEYIVIRRLLLQFPCTEIFDSPVSYFSQVSHDVYYHLNHYLYPQNEIESSITHVYHSLLEAIDLPTVIPQYRHHGGLGRSITFPIIHVDIRLFEARPGEDVPSFEQSLLDHMLQQQQAAALMMNNNINRLLNESFNNEAAHEPVPADSEAILALEKLTVADLPYQNQNIVSDNCVICLERFEVCEELLTTPCSHIFHKECIVKWFTTSHLCPLCRFQMPTK